jgi:hypothetical protein
MVRITGRSDWTACWWNSMMSGCRRPPRRRRHHPHPQPHGTLRRPGQMLMIWTAEPGSKSAEALSLLGSWAATPEQREPQDVPDHL